MGEGANTSLINLGELAKPATVLIEKVSDAIGGICKPWQIRRVAQADADAAMIAEKMNIRLTELQERALHRMIREEEKHQRNIEDITAKALPHLKPDADASHVSDDWVCNFFAKSRTVSDADMQELWGRILAGEANQPGTYSKRTIAFIESLDKRDAEIFTRLCGYAWHINGQLSPVVYNEDDLRFSELTHLERIGLISYDPHGMYAISEMPRHSTLKYFHDTFHMDFERDEDNSIGVGSVILSELGEELARVCEPGARPGFIEECLSRWHTSAVALSSPYPRAPQEACRR